MKLLTYEPGGGPRAGVLVGERVLDAASLLGVEPLQDLQALLELPNRPLDRLREALDRTHDEGVALSSVRLRAPILQPPTIRDFFVFEGHASAGGTRQLSDAWYRMPIFYFSNTLRVFGPDEPVPATSVSERFDYELEIGAVIGREGSNVPASDALDYIAGFTIFNDWSNRDLQRDESQVGLGPAKGKDSATSLGPWVVTTDELAPFVREDRLHVRCSVRVNGELWMEGDAGDMYHSWADIIERATRDSRIVPGDVLGSGTVTGGSIGEASPAQPGDGPDRP